ncbi:hypothetical protein KUM39_14005 [Streptomyces sp. J2-1]|nr:hypothetical protein [Streptomyces corallincola]
MPKAAASAASSTPDNARPADGKAAPGHSAAKAAGIPPEPSGPKRARLLHDLSAVSPNIVKYEDKAVAAARNQCSSINGGGARLDHTAAQRFSYKDVKTTEAQGRQINQALRSSGFCKV